MGCVYLALNTVNGKGYVGKTVKPLPKRRRRHEFESQDGSGYPFHKAIAKYGIDAFKWSILFESDDEDLLLAEEQWQIAALNTKAPAGYNLTNGGEGTTGLKRSQETKNRMSWLKKGVKFTESHKAALKASHTQERKEKYKKSVTGRAWKKLGPRSEETKRKISLAQKGKVIPQEMRDRISKTLTGRSMPPRTAAYCEAIRKRQTGKRHTEETKAKIRATKATNRLSRLNQTPIL